MAMVMPAVVDDTSIPPGQNGTVLTKAVWDAVGTAVDLVTVPGTNAPTTTGTQTAEPLPTTGLSDLVTYHNNATLKTIQGMVAGIAGQRWTHYSKGAGQVDFAHLHASGTALGKLQLCATTGLTSLAAGSGVAVFQYDATLTVWRLVSHEQGGWIAFTPTWAASGTQPVINNGTLAGRYRLSGRTVTFEILVTMGSTTTFGTGTYTLTFPLTAAATIAACGPLFLNDVSASQYVGVWRRLSATTFDLFNAGSPATAVAQTVPVTWATSDTWQVSGQYEVS